MKETIYVEIDRGGGVTETRGVSGTHEEVIEMLESWERQYGPVKIIHPDGWSRKGAR